MAAIKSKNTKPEVILRRLIYKAGYRYKIHDKKVCGKPDIVFRKYNTIIFIHGCFWHAHGCKLGKLPKSNLHYWFPKLKKNLIRDKHNIEKLVNMGWKVLIIWECAIVEATRLPDSALLASISAFLKSEDKKASIQGLN